MKPVILLDPLRDTKATLYYGANVLDSLAALPANSVHMTCFSPPYWGLRSYGTVFQIWGGDPGCQHVWGDTIPQDSKHRWIPEHCTKEGPVSSAGGYPSERGAFCQLCGAWRGELGLEPTFKMYIQHIVLVCKALKRVLRDDGTLWINLGDSYNGSGGAGGDYGPGGLREGQPRYPGRNVKGLKAKDLVGIPWRVALAIQNDGWWLRSDIVWEKPNAMPESVTDRPTRAHEYVFLLTQSERYFYDHIAVREPHKEVSIARRSRARGGGKFQGSDGGQPLGNPHSITVGIDQSLHPVGANKRSVWHVSTKPYKGAHFAVWPEALVGPMVQAGSSEKGCCPHCGAPWERVTENPVPVAGKDVSFVDRREGTQGRQIAASRTSALHTSGTEWEKWKEKHPSRTLGWRATCSCPDHDPIPCTVLDPFSGSATTGAVALRLGRNYIGLDLQKKYLPLAEARLNGDPTPKKTEETPVNNLIWDLFAPE